MPEKPEVETVSEELTVFNVGDRRLELREMKIGRTRKLGEMMSIFHNDSMAFLKGRDQNAPIDPKFREMVDLALLKIFNFLFRLEGEKALTQEWVEENLSFRTIEAVVKEAARQSRIDWLPPFFNLFFQTSKAIIIAETTTGNSANGNPTT